MTTNDKAIGKEELLKLAETIEVNWEMVAKAANGYPPRNEFEYQLVESQRYLSAGIKLLAQHLASKEPTQ